MSTLDTANARLSADDRYELATRAQNQHRLNSPRHLIMLGLLLLVIALVVLGVAWQTQSAAIDKNERAARDLVKIENLITEIRALELAQADSTLEMNFEPLPDILSTLESIARRAQLESELGLPRNAGSRPEGNAILKTYPYTISDPSLEHLLDWVKISEQEIPGLQVRELSIQPRNQLWTLSVVLARYERKP
jgi:hypothetical protein